MSLEDALKKNKHPLPTVDAYVCPDLHVTITKVVAEKGKVPPEISCQMCKQPARSLGFNVNQNFNPHFEWYKPDQADILRLTSGMDIPQQNRFIEMVNKGMLVARPCVESKFNQSPEIVPNDKG